MTKTNKITRCTGISRRTLLKASAVGVGTVGLADAAASQESETPNLDLETLEADTEGGTLQAGRAENSYVGPIDEGQAIGIAFLDEVGAGEDQNSSDEIVVYLYDRAELALLLGEINAEGVATLESDELSAFAATVELIIEDDAVSGTVSFRGKPSTTFTADAATGVGGVYWAHGTDEDPDVRADWVVLSDGRQWGCACHPPGTSPCCHLGRL